MGDTLRDDRDRALLAVGFAGGFRRSELVALEVADLEEVPEGYRVTVRRSKTDQDGAGMTKALVYGQHDQTCPVRLLRGYMQRGGITEGPIFRPTRGGEWNRALTDRTVANIVKRAAALVGKAPGAFSGHSLRRGFVTEAARNGASERAIAKQTGHRSVAVLRSIHRGRHRVRGQRRGVAWAVRLSGCASSEGATNRGPSPVCVAGTLRP